MGIVGNANGKAQELLKKLNDDGLLLSFEMLIEQRDKAKNAEMRANLNQARIWVIDELERRFPEVNSVIEKALMDENDQRNYDQVLIDAVMKSLAKKN